MICKVRVGFAGLGIMGELYADAIHEFPNSYIAGVADTVPARRELALKKYDCQVYDSYDEMFKRAGLDAVIITLPDFLHRDAVISAARAGINILVEKPLAMSTEDAAAMAEAVYKAGVICAVEFFNRWNIQFAQAKEMVDNGVLGKLLSISADLNDTVYVPTEMLKWSAKSSPVWFLMSHTADLASWITGKKPSSVFSRGVKQLLVSRGIDTYDVVESLVEYCDGTVGRFTNGWILPRAFPIVYELKMRFIGSDAAIDIDTSDQQMHFFSHGSYQHSFNAWGKVLGSYVGHCFEMLRSFIGNVQNGTQPVVTIKDGLENTRLLEAVHTSLRIGQPVQVKY